MLEIKNLCYTVMENGKKLDVLKNISLTVDDNEIIVITGHNGSGKSTLAKLIMGIITPTSGEIFYNGKNITSLPINERAKLGIAFAFQQPVCFKGLTVRDMIDISIGSHCSVSTACEHLSKVGLCAKEYIYRQVDNKLSGGELKRIELAIVLARNAQMNIFDEPEAGIDLWSFNTLVDIFKNNNATNIIISHQNKLIEIADKIILLNDGQIEKFGTKDEVLPYLHSNQCHRFEGGKKWTN